MKFLAEDGTYINDATALVLPVGAVALTDNEWNARRSELYQPTQAEIKDRANAELIRQIEALDFRRVRPLAEGDATYLEMLNAQVVALRAQLVK